MSGDSRARCAAKRANNILACGALAQAQHERLIDLVECSRLISSEC